MTGRMGLTFLEKAKAARGADIVGEKEERYILDMVS